MKKEETYTIRLNEDLKKDFIWACERTDLPASHHIRELMRGFINDVKQQIKEKQPKVKK